MAGSRRTWLEQWRDLVAPLARLRSDAAFPIIGRPSDVGRQRYQGQVSVPSIRHSARVRLVEGRGSTSGTQRRGSRVIVNETLAGLLCRTDPTAAAPSTHTREVIGVVRTARLNVGSRRRSDLHNPAQEVRVRDDGVRMPRAIEGRRRCDRTTEGRPDVTWMTSSMATNRQRSGTCFSVGAFVTGCSGMGVLLRVADHLGG